MDEGTQVYRVIRGTLKLLSTSDGGDDVVFSIMGTGELVAEIGFLGSPTRTATVSALTESELLAIDRRDLLSFLKAHPEAAFESMAVLAPRINLELSQEEWAVCVQYPAPEPARGIRGGGGKSRGTQGGVT